MYWKISSNGLNNSKEQATLQVQTVFSNKTKNPPHQSLYLPPHSYRKPCRTYVVPNPVDRLN